MGASDWMVANLNMLGYYRVNYDMENWRKLLQTLQTSHEVPTTAKTIRKGRENTQHPSTNSVCERLECSQPLLPV